MKYLKMELEIYALSLASLAAKSSPFSLSEGVARPLHSLSQGLMSSKSLPVYWPILPR